MLIEDHINLQGGSPLAFKNVAEFGIRFVDMSQPYDIGMGKKIKEIAARENITLQNGVYASVVGPQLETKAEYRMLKTIGADAVGMSTVPEVLAARDVGMRVLAASIITNVASTDTPLSTSHAEVVDTGQQAGPRLLQMITQLLEDMAGQPD